MWCEQQIVIVCVETEQEWFQRLVHNKPITDEVQPRTLGPRSLHVILGEQKNVYFDALCLLCRWDAITFALNQAFGNVMSTQRGWFVAKVKSICWQNLFATFITNTVLSLTCAHLNKDSLIILEVFVITFLLYNYECVDRYADHFSFLTYWHQYDENVELVLSQLGGRVLWMFWQNHSILCLGNDFRVPFMLLWLTSKDRLLNSRGLASRVCTSPNQLISKPARLCSL